MLETTASVMAAEVERIGAMPPFDRLPPALVADVLAQSSVVFHRHGTIVCHPRIAESSHCLWMVRQGSVRAAALGDDAAAAVGEEILGVGAVLPLESALSGGPAWRVYTTNEDSFLWRIDGEPLERLLAEAAFLRWLASELQAANQRLREANATLLHGRQLADQALALPVRTLGNEAIACVPATTSIGEAAALMTERKIGSVLVGSVDAVEGIVTQSDLVQRAMATGMTYQTPIAAIMTAEPAAIEDTASVLDAAMEMAKRGFRHLLVKSAEGPVSGIVSERDLFRAQQHGIAHIQTPIDEAQSVDEIVDLAARIREFTARVFRQGMAVTQFTRLVSSINDRLTRRLLTLIVGERHPEWHFCWLAFGSEGREEQGFVTDQDNGIVFVPPSPADTERVRAEFLTMARTMNEALHAAGFERCKGNIMAGNPEWCLSLDEWQNKFSRWVRATTPTALLNATIFFDFRPIHGEAALAEQMRDHLLDEVRGNTIFLHMLAKNALEVSPPLGALNRFRTDGGEHKGTLDLKTQGSRLFVDVARIYALANGVRTANTEQRLATVGKRINRSVSAIDGDIAALRFIQGLRLRRQLDSLRDGSSANRLDPYALNDLDQRMLRESLRQAQSLQDRLKLDYPR
jgi:CBS domain-containing protein